jgi:Trk K+ transport system NAD-binding subunit
MANPDHFIVCGLGSLGQHGVAILSEFGGVVSAIEIHVPTSWELPEVPGLLAALEVGDCRNPEALERAGIRQCQAILLVTSNEQVNIEAAFAARLLNPKVRLVVRSAKQNLNQLLAEKLGNFIAFEPTQLSALAFALAALRNETLGFFNLEDQRFQVVQHQVQEGERRFINRQVHELNGRFCRVIAYLPTTELLPPTNIFYGWDPEATVAEGDTVILLETLQESSLRRTDQTVGPFQRYIEAFQSGTLGGYLQQQVKQRWQEIFQENQIQRVAIILGFSILLLLVAGGVILEMSYPGLSLVDAFYATGVLLLGNYSDLFGNFIPDVPVPWWVRLFSFGLSLAGIALVGVLYALLTEKLLTLKFQFLRRRPPVPEKDHVVIIGLGRVGRRVAEVLRELGQAVVGLDSHPDEALLSPTMPLLTGNITVALNRANLNTAQSIVTVTEDEMVNLELGLMAQTINPNSSLVIRAYNQRFSNNVAQLFPEAQVLCASALSAEAFAAAAYGEDVLGLFRVLNKTVLVAEYTIESNDTLIGLLLAEIAYGYGMLPVRYQKAREAPKILPSDDIRLESGDHLVVLATISALEHVERAEMAPRTCRIHLEKAYTKNSLFEGAPELSLTTGCSMAMARAWMEQLPITLPIPLYHQQALRLVRKLDRLQIVAHVALND